MAGFQRELIVDWGDCDPFGIVYYPRMVAWFNETEHRLFRHIGYPAEAMIASNQALVMGEIGFRFVGPARPGDRIVTEMALSRIGERTLHWNCRAFHGEAGAPILEGRATRVYVTRAADGTLNSAPVTEPLRQALTPWTETP